MPALPSYAELQFSGYSLQDASIVERSEVERGPAKTRRSATDPMVTTNGTLFFKSQQAIAAFRAWFYSASGANAGARWFDWTDPRTNTLRSIRFVSMGALTPLSGRFALAQQPVVFEYLETVEEIASLAPRRWDFTTDLEGWSGYPAYTSASWSSGLLILRPIDGQGTIAESPPGLGLVGWLYSRLRLSVRRVAGAGWSGIAYYTTANHGESGSFFKQIPDPLISVGGSAVLEWDMSQLTAGGDDWIGSVIGSLRIDFGSTGFDQFDIDWIEVVAS